MDLKKAIEEAKKSKKRGFTQTVEMKINLTGIDPKSFSINEIYELPKGINKKRTVCAVGSGDFLLNAKKCADLTLDIKKDMDRFKSKKDRKKWAEGIDFFVVEAPAMAEFAKNFGPILAPRGKMPAPQHILPPGSNPCPRIEKVRRSVRVVGKKSPVVHCVIGTEDMSTDDLESNAQHILEHVMNKLPKGKHNIKGVYIKLTMGKAVRASG